MNQKLIAGVCRFCRCKGDTCKLADGDRCTWFDSERTICTAPVCLAAHFREIERERRRANQRPRRRSPAEIFEIQKQEQLARRRRARAEKRQRETKNDRI